MSRVRRAGGVVFLETSNTPHAVNGLHPFHGHPQVTREEDMQLRRRQGCYKARVGDPEGPPAPIGDVGHWLLGWGTGSGSFCWLCVERASVLADLEA